MGWASIDFSAVQEVRPSPNLLSHCSHSFNSSLSFKIPFPNLKNQRGKTHLSTPLCRQDLGYVLLHNPLEWSRLPSASRTSSQLPRNSPYLRRAQNTHGEVKTCQYSITHLHINCCRAQWKEHLQAAPAGQVFSKFIYRVKIGRAHV